MGRCSGGHFRHRVGVNIPECLCHGHTTSSISLEDWRDCVIVGYVMREDDRSHDANRSPHHLPIGPPHRHLHRRVQGQMYMRHDLKLYMLPLGRDAPDVTPRHC